MTAPLKRLSVDLVIPPAWLILMIAVLSLPLGVAAARGAEWYAPILDQISGSSGYGLPAIAGGMFGVFMFLTGVVIASVTEVRRG